MATMIPYPDILVVTTDAATKATLEEFFATQATVSYCASAPEALTQLQHSRFSHCLLDVRTVDNGALDTALIHALSRSVNPGLLILLTPPHQLRMTLEQMRAGAGGYLMLPLQSAQLEALPGTADAHSQLPAIHASSQVWGQSLKELQHTCSPMMKRVIDAARCVSRTGSTVLITGETGTGKGVLAKLIHQSSSRSHQPFIGVHCGAIPDNLIESELFGHEKGAFTGAVNRKLGKFELAHGGTIFLDEVGTMSLSAQVKLLKVLQERTFQRVGAERDIEVDVRVIAAANRDLFKMSEKGEFRSDLFYRLNVFPLELPPLRERREDIGHLLGVFLERLNQLHGKNITTIRPEVLEALEHYSWPGNIRELENILERAYILETTSMLSADSFPPEIVPPLSEPPPPPLTIDTRGTLAQIRQRAIEESEERYLRDKLAQCNGRIDRTALEAGITPRQLHKLMTKYRLRKESFR